MQKYSLLENIEKLLEGREEIIFAYLYGSFISENRYKDVDLAVFIEPEKIPEEKALKYQLRASGEFSYKLDVSVDIKVLNYAPLPFQMRVLKTGKVIKENRGKRSDFIEEVSTRHFDHTIFKKSFEEELKNIVKENISGLHR